MAGHHLNRIGHYSICNHCPSNHPRLRLRGNPLCSNDPAIYTGEDISLQCIRALELSLHRMSSRQDCGMQRLIHLFEQDERLDSTAWPHYSILNAYKDAFCDFLFPRGLKSFVKLKLETNGRRGLFGTTETHSEHGAPYVLIKLFNPRLRGTSMREMRANILQTLLHELLHSLFWVYLCPGERCLTGSECYDTYGFTGHGPSWVYLAAKLQETVSRWPFLVEVLQPRGSRVPLRIIARTHLEVEGRSAEEHGFSARFYPDLFPEGLPP